MIDRTHLLPVTQCQLLDLNRSTVNYQLKGVSAKDLKLVRLIDALHLKRPFYGSRRIRDDLQDLGYPVSRKKVQRLMRQMGVMALYPKRNTRRPGKGHKIYPYLLKHGETVLNDLPQGPIPWNRIFSHAQIIEYQAYVTRQSSEG